MFYWILVSICVLIFSLNQDIYVENCILLKDAQNDLESEIKKVISRRIGPTINGKVSSSDTINLFNFDIRGWPSFVPIDPFLWDEICIKDLRNSISSFVFTFNEKLSRNLHYKKSKVKLLMLLLDKLNEELNSKFKTIPWDRLNIRNWPKNVFKSPELWIPTDLLLIYRSVNHLKFELIADMDKEANVEVALRSSLKRKFEDGNVSNLVHGHSVSSLIQGKVDDLLLSKAQNPVSSLSQADFLVPSIVPSVVPSAHCSYYQVTENDFINLSVQIFEMAMKQMKIVEIKLEDYEIENWPPFVSVNHYNWDERCFKDLQAALPLLKFSLKPFYEQIESELKRNTRLLLNLLSDRYKEQNGLVSVENFEKFKVKEGWPVEISVISKKWRPLDILIIYRHLHEIKFDLKPMKSLVPPKTRSKKNQNVVQVFPIDQDLDLFLKEDGNFDQFDEYIQFISDS